MSTRKVFFSIVSLILCLCLTAPALAGVLKLPEGVKVIEDEAFYKDTSLDEVILPEGIEEIGERAFAESSLRKINLPDSLQYVADNAFDNCVNLEHEGEPTVSPDDFKFEENGDETCTVTGYKKTPSGDLVIPSKSPKGSVVTSIGPSAFKDCSGFSGRLIIPDCVSNIGDSAFEWCNGFTGSLMLPDSVTNIGSSAFRFCIGFTGSLTIPESLTSISSSAFHGCSGFTGSLIIPNSVTSIGDYAFYECSGFTGSLTIPNSVTSIEYSAFSKCSGFTGSLTIPDSVTSIGSHAFSDCRGFTGSLTIPNNVTSIGGYAFVGCSGFTGSLIIPDSVTNIGNGAFYGCNGFTGSLRIPDSITNIGSKVFSGCSGFTGSLTIPDSVTGVGDSAFYGCSGFTSLTIPNSVTIIDRFAFAYCSGFMGSLIIPDNVTYIGGAAFYKCSGFTGSLIIPDSITNIQYSTFEGCGAFTGSLIIPDSVTYIGNHSFDGCRGFTGALTIPNRVTYIENNAFNGCSGLSGKLSISDSVTHIESDVFRGCNFERVSVPVTDDDGTTHEVSRIAVYCPVDSYAWRWATEQSDFEPVEWDGSSTPTTDPTITGSFTNRTMTIVLGDTSQIPAATVQSTGDPIHRVTLTISGWQPEGSTSDRYRTHTFENQNLQEISLTDPEWAADFMLDTTQPPLNVPGEYTLNLWANTSDTETSSEPLDSMTVYVGWVGYVMADWIDTYASSTAPDSNGRVDNKDPVIVIKEENGRYYIRMVLSSGGYDFRWVNKELVSNMLIAPTFDDCVLDQEDKACFRIAMPSGVDRVLAEIKYYSMNSYFREQKLVMETQKEYIKENVGHEFELLIDNPQNSGVGVFVKLSFFKGEELYAQEELIPFYFMNKTPDKPTMYWPRYNPPGRVVPTPWNSISYEELAPVCAELGFNQEVTLLAYDEESGVSYINLVANGTSMNAFTVISLDDNPCIKRGYIYIADSISSDTEWADAWSDEVASISQLMLGSGCLNPINLNTDVKDISDFNSVIFNEADENDLTYIHFFCHHTAQSNGGFCIVEKKGGAVDGAGDDVIQKWIYDDEFARMIKRIKGDIILSFSACEAGSFTELISDKSRSETYFDPMRYTVIAPVQEDISEVSAYWTWEESVTDETGETRTIKHPIVDAELNGGGIHAILMRNLYQSTSENVTVELLRSRLSSYTFEDLISIYPEYADDPDYTNIHNLEEYAWLHSTFHPTYYGDSGNVVFTH